MEKFALSNPLTILLDKPREEFDRESLIRVIEQKQIERITFHYTGLDGKIKELKIPVASRVQAERVLADGERVDGSSLFKGMIDVAVSDLYVVPIYKTAFINPFDERSLNFVCRYINNKGEFAPYALDNILHNAVSLFKKNTGLELYALGELEFFLLSDADSALFPSTRQRGYHSSAPYLKTGEILDEMVRYLTQITGTIKYAHSEVGSVEKVRSDIEEIKNKRAEQLEIEFLPAPAEDAADNLVLARWLIRNVAYKNRCVATFTPKLEEGIAGNGMHIHMELRKNGKNIMTSGGKLSEDARKLIGGLCQYADSLTGFGNSVSSAYLRLVPNQEAPTRICWSDMNRSAMIRVPLGWADIDNLASKINPQQVEKLKDIEARQTVELRSPDGSANVHLLLAGIVMAAEWGLTHKDALSLAEQYYVTGNIFKDKEILSKLPVLPGSCVDSAEILTSKRELYERENIFPKSVIDYVAKKLQAEDDEDMNSFLSDLPADERLLETRKIMHKDIHNH
ncbi:MAG: glutamine synthetase [Ignavibacteriaceae bacterium]|nr:glutamine synthetase [Ignavibacteriaceae bacterium]